MKKGVVYRLVNKVNGKSYIGRTMDLGKRMYEHKKVAANATGKTLDRPIVKAIREFGIEAFDIEILYSSELFEDREQLDILLDEKEKFFIEKYNTTEEGYNLTKGGKGAYGLGSRIAESWTKEKRKQLSERMSGENNPCYGKKFKGIKKPTLLGKKLSEERRAKISQAMKGKGHSQTNETKQKISAKLRGVPKSESHKRNASNAKKGLKVPSKWKPVLQYSSDGVFMKEWESIKAAQKVYGTNQISCCAKGKFATIAGYAWRYKTSDDIPLKIEIPKPKNFREVAQVDKEGNIILKCNTLKELAKKIGLTYNVALNIKNGKPTREKVDFRIVYLD